MFKASMLDSSYPISLTEVYNLMKQAGFDSVMLGWRDDNKREKPDKARKAGLLIENIHAPFKNADHIWLDNLCGDGYMACLLASINDCREYGIPTMVAHLINEYNPPPPSDVGIERLKRVAEKAEHDHINVAFENTYSPDHLRFVFDHIPSQKFGFCFDSGHQNCMTPGCNLLNEFGDRLMAMHLNDNFGAQDRNKQNEHPTVEMEATKQSSQQFDLHLLPFDGTIDWNKITQQIKTIQYKGAIALEVGPYLQHANAPEAFYNTAFERVIKLLDMVNH